MNQCACQPAGQSIPSDGPIPGLGSFVGDPDPDLAPEGGQQPLPLLVVENGRPLDVEADLGSGVGSVGVLTTRPTRSAERPLELTDGNDEVLIDLQIAVGAR